MSIPLSNTGESVVAPALPATPDRSCSRGKRIVSIPLLTTGESVVAPALPAAPDRSCPVPLGDIPCVAHEKSWKPGEAMEQSLAHAAVTFSADMTPSTPSTTLSQNREASRKEE